MRRSATAVLFGFCALSLLAQQPSATFIHQGDLAVLNFQWEEAIYFYSQEIQTNPNSYWGLFSRGMVEFQMGKISAAELDMQTAISLNPKSAALHLAMAQIKAREGLQKALPEISQAINLNPNYYDAYMKRAEMETIMNDNQQALDDYDKAIVIKPEAAKPYALKALLRYEMGSAVQSQESGKISQESSDSKLAALDKTISLMPNDAVGFNYKGLLFLKMGRFNEAVSAYQKAIEMDASQPAAYLNLADFYFARQNDLAIVNYDKSIEAYKHLYIFLILKSEGGFATDPEEAMNDYGNALSDMVHIEMCLSKKAIWEDTTGHPDAAVNYFTEASKYNPQYTPPYISLLQFSSKTANLSSLLSMYNQTFQIYHDPRILLERGNFKKKMGDFDGAVADFSEVIKADPNSSARMERAYIYTNSGHSEEALKDLDNVKGNLNRSIGEDYLVYFQWLNHSLLGQEDILKAYVLVIDEKKWTSTIGKYLIGQLSDEDFLKQANDHPDPQDALRNLSEAEYWIGSKHLVTGDLEGAKNFYLKCVDSRDTQVEDFYNAQIALRRIEAPGFVLPSGKPKPILPD